MDRARASWREPSPLAGVGIVFLPGRGEPPAVQQASGDQAGDRPADEDDRMVAEREFDDRQEGDDNRQERWKNDLPELDVIPQRLNEIGAVYSHGSLQAISPIMMRAQIRKALHSRLSAR